MFDAIVVGARCAGAPTAMLLARAGYRVLMLDRAAFPSDTLSTHLIHQPGVAALARWGLLDRVRASGCPPLDRAVYEVADIRLEGCARGVRDSAPGTPRAATSWTPSWWTPPSRPASSSATDLGHRPPARRDRPRHRRGGQHRGRTFTERARLVIGADGMRSTVARLSAGALHLEDPRLTCAYYAYWEDVPAALELYETAAQLGGRRADQRQRDARPRLLPAVPVRRGPHRRRHAYLGQMRTTAPALYERLRGKERVERLRGTGDQQNFFRQAAGPGWALVGDAGHHKDSITARGISDAFLQAESLDAARRGPARRRPERLDQALRTTPRTETPRSPRATKSTLAAAQLDSTSSGSHCCAQCRRTLTSQRSISTWSPESRPSGPSTPRSCWP